MIKERCLYFRGIYFIVACILFFKCTTPNKILYKEHTKDFSGFAMITRGGAWSFSHYKMKISNVHTFKFWAYNNAVRQSATINTCETVNAFNSWNNGCNQETVIFIKKEKGVSYFLNIEDSKFRKIYCTNFNDFFAILFPENSEKQRINAFEYYGKYKTLKNIDKIKINCIIFCDDYAKNGILK